MCVHGLRMAGQALVGWGHLPVGHRLLGLEGAAKLGRKGYDVRVVCTCSANSGGWRSRLTERLRSAGACVSAVLCLCVCAWGVLACSTT